MKTGQLKTGITTNDKETFFKPVMLQESILVILICKTHGTKYSKMGQVKLPQILLGLFLNTLSHIR